MTLYIYASMDAQEHLPYIFPLSQIMVVVAACVVVPLAARLAFPNMTREIWADLRIPRIFHYILLAGLGSALWIEEAKPALDADLLPRLGLLFIFACSLSYAAVFAIVSNNVEDLEADRISNPQRPLVRGSVDPGQYWWAGILCQGLSLMFAALVSWEMFWGVLSISAGYFIYSCRPFRLKRIPILSKVIIGINSLAVCVCGYALSGGEWLEFPLPWALFVLLPLSLAANFVDLKDIEGDRATGIATLPVMLGQKKATWLIAGFTALAYGMAAILLAEPIWLPLFALQGVIHLALLMRRPYREAPIFFAYLLGLVGLNLLLIFGDQILALL